VTQVDITKIDRDFFGVSGLLPELVNIVGYDSYHPHTIFMDVTWMSSSACHVCASTAALLMAMSCHLALHASAAS
jgi:hypothetical protein